LPRGLGNYVESCPDGKCVVRRSWKTVEAGRKDGGRSVGTRGVCFPDTGGAHLSRSPEVHMCSLGWHGPVALRTPVGRH
jgi:hypothetical protein